MSEPTGNNSANPADQNGNQPTQVQPPEGLSPSFWDGDKNEVKLNDLIADHGNLSKFKTESEARFKDRPESPDKYELKLPETVKLPEGAEFRFEPDSPLMKTARQLAFDSGRGQAGFEEMLGLYAQSLIDMGAEDETFAAEQYQAEMTKLGDKAKDRTDAVDSYLKANLSEDEYKALSAVTTTAAAVQAVEKLMTLSRDKNPQTGDVAQSPKLSEAELQSMMRDPKYWRDHDPAFIQQVSEGFKKLYPGQQPTSH